MGVRQQPQYNNDVNDAMPILYYAHTHTHTRALKKCTSLIRYWHKYMMVYIHCYATLAFYVCCEGEHMFSK